jgi:hypothetical protein
MARIFSERSLTLSDTGLICLPDSGAMPMAREWISLLMRPEQRGYAESDYICLTCINDYKGVFV